MFNFKLLIFFYIIKLASTYSNEENCEKQKKCHFLNSTKCLDITLPYKYSSLDNLLSEFNFKNELEIHEYLEKWIGLKSVPRCWASIQPLLCTTFFPRCNEDKVPSLSYQICKNVKSNCKIIDQYVNLNNIKTLPSFLNCNDTDLYDPKCRNEYKDIKFNSSAARCDYPLVSTEDSKIYYKDIEGCALNCDDPLYDTIEKKNFQSFILWSASISLIIVLFSVLSYIFMWKNLQQTSKFIFYIQVCFLIHYFGWLMQSLIDKKSIVCRNDQTLKYSEPKGGFFCILNFIMIYFSSFSILSWYIVMAITIKFSNKSNFFKNSTIYLHLFAWSTSFLFTIMAIAFSQIDGNYIYGICFIGFSHKLSRLIFIFIPLIIGSFIIIYGMLNRAIHISLMIHQLALNIKKRNDYKKIYKRLGFCSLSTFIILVFCFIVNYYKSLEFNEYLESLNERILCQLKLDMIFGLKVTCYSKCNNNLKKSLTLDYWIILFIFGSGILSSLWNINFITINFWILKFKQREKKVEQDKKEKENVFLQKLLKDNKQDPVKMNLSTVTTNPDSNHNNRDFNQSKSTKTNDSKSSNLLEIYQKHKEKRKQKLLEKKMIKQSKKNEKLEQNLNQNNMQSLEMISIQPCIPQFNQTNAFLNQQNFNNSFKGIISNPQFNNDLNKNLENTQVDLRSINNSSQNIKTNGIIKHQLDQSINKLEKKKETTTFITHGMSDQNKLNKFINNTLGNNENINNQGIENLFKNQVPNKVEQNKESIPTVQNINNFNDQMYSVQNPFNCLPYNFMLNPQNMMPNVHQTLNNFMPLVYPSTNLPPILNQQNQLNLQSQFIQQQQLFNTQINFQNQFYQQQQQIRYQQLLQQQYTSAQNSKPNCKTIEDIETATRERSETLHICQTIDSASETNEPYPPIQNITESECSSLSDLDCNYLGRLPSTAEKVVKARLQHLDDDSS